LNETTLVENKAAGIMEFLLWRNAFDGMFACIVIAG
jgi:hypothetical protein